jgi:hypothetical protein
VYARAITRLRDAATLYLDGRIIREIPLRHTLFFSGTERVERFPRVVPTSHRRQSALTPRRGLLITTFSKPKPRK